PSKSGVAPRRTPRPALAEIAVPRAPTRPAAPEEIAQIADRHRIAIEIEKIAADDVPALGLHEAAAKTRAAIEPADRSYIRLDARQRSQRAGDILPALVVGQHGDSSRGMKTLHAQRRDGQKVRIVRIAVHRQRVADVKAGSAPSDWKARDKMVQPSNQTRHSMLSGECCFKPASLTERQRSGWTCGAARERDTSPSKAGSWSRPRCK